MANSASTAIKLCLLEKRALKLLEEAAEPSKILPYNEATRALARLRIDRKIALKLLSEFEREGLVKQSCGHGIKLKEGR